MEMEDTLRRVSVVLVEPRSPGNIGAVARAMANMGVGPLVLIDAADPLAPEARHRAMGGLGRLESAREAASGC